MKERVITDSTLTICDQIVWVTVVKDSVALTHQGSGFKFRKEGCQPLKVPIKLVICLLCNKCYQTQAEMYNLVYKHFPCR